MVGKRRASMRRCSSRSSKRVAGLEVLDRELEMAEQRLVDVDPAVADVEVEPALEAVGLGVDRVHVRACLDPARGTGSARSGIGSRAVYISRILR